MENSSQRRGIDQLREELMGDLVPLNNFAAAMGKHPKTVKRMGPPLVYIGRDPFVPKDGGRAWLQNGCKPIEPERRGRGRPRGGGAA